MMMEGNQLKNRRRYVSVYLSSHMVSGHSTSLNVISGDNLSQRVAVITFRGCSIAAGEGAW